MSYLRAPERLFRAPHSERAERVTFVELFFDLVFVFAITQLSHFLIEHLTPIGIAQAAIMVVAVWWVWMYTTWATNWLDPDTGPVRGLLISLMLVGLVLSTSIPEAYGERSLGFAVAYVVMQFGRTLLVTLAYVRVDQGYARNLLRITIWFAASAPFWIVGAVIGGTAQIWLWLIAIVIEITGPSMRYRTPGLGSSGLETWNVSGSHMAERSGLFIIIALGESILVTGSAFSATELSAESASAFLAAFVGTIVLWLLYFSHGAEGGSRFISRAAQTGEVARLSYVYLHIPIVSGIVLVAVGDELVLHHPTGEIELAAAAAIAGGPALYLAGVLFFKRSVGEPWPFSHVLAAVACVALLATAMLVREEWLSALVLSWLINAVLVATVIVDEAGARRRTVAGVSDG